MLAFLAQSGSGLYTKSDYGTVTLIKTRILVTPDNSKPFYEPFAWPLLRCVALFRLGTFRVQ